MTFITTDIDTSTETQTQIDVLEAHAPDADTAGPQHDDTHRPDGRQRPRLGAGAIAVAAAVAASVGATALLIDRAADEPAPAPVPAPLSGNDTTLGYILSADYPTEFHDAPSASVRLSGTDAALAYILSADYPVDDAPAPSANLSGNDAALAYIFSADYPVGRVSNAGDVADPIGAIFSAAIADLAL